MRLLRRWPWIVGLLLAAASIFASVELTRSTGFASASAIATLIGLPLTTVSCFAALVALRSRAESAASPKETPSGMADELAGVVYRQWDAEARLRRLYDPYPLPLTWKGAPPSLADSWDSLVAMAAAWPGSSRAAPPCPSDAAAITGSDRDLAEIFEQRIPTHRLVVLGAPGSGKTMLLVRLILELLTRRNPGGPVPILVSCATWDPDADDFDSWLTKRMGIEYPALGQPAAPDVSRARMLLERNLVLPVLDGFDELNDERRPSALRALNESLGPGRGMVVSSRVDQYRDTLLQDPDSVPLRGAACIELEALNTSVVVDYLSRGLSPVATRRWSPVLAALQTSTPLAATLTTPLMVGLARSIYAPRVGESLQAVRDPEELCDTARFPRPEAIRKHLFDAFIPSAYRSHPDPSQRARWRARKAERWLVSIATHLEEDRGRTTDIAWWAIQRAASPLFFVICIGVMCGVAMGTATGLVDVIGVGVGVGVLTAMPIGLILRSTVLRALPSATGGLSGGLVGGFGGGILGGLTAELAFGTPDQVASTAATGLAIGAAVGPTVGLGSSRGRGAKAGLITGLVGGLVGGLFDQRLGPVSSIALNALGCAVIGGLNMRNAVSVPAKGFRWSVVGVGVGIIAGLGIGVMVALTTTATIGIAVGGLVAVTAAFAGGMETASAHVTKAASPRLTLTHDRTAFFALTAAFGVPVGLSTGFTIGVVREGGIAAGIVAGMCIGVAVGVWVGCLQTAWGQFLVVRVWQAVRGDLPWRLIGFLEDAHLRRGVLRQVGPVYQFRHAELQHRLATRE
ncbi:NACHT domain-containing protein [Amycolatopsis sp. MJM2582]|uniref:NACHT domain-containing protein n=1 Tax=Amycolatopsis sp. MJM2582 TaxID=1427749 RepID=UPI000691EDCC|nr:NACHT domain-containing protein [Amycolatopsis sp. MJM2582]